MDMFIGCMLSLWEEGHPRGSEVDRAVKPTLVLNSTPTSWLNSCPSVVKWPHLSPLLDNQLIPQFVSVLWE